MASKRVSKTPTEKKEYEVEKICGRRIRNGKVEYCIKWKGYREEENTFEPEEDVLCKDLIKEFEAARRKAMAERKAELEAEESKRALQKRVRAEKSRAGNTNSFDEGHEAEELLGATNAGGELKFFIKFKGLPNPELLPASVVNVKIPQMVIKFYEKHRLWDDVPKQN